MTGTLFLVPAALGDSPWEATLPPSARERACSLDYFIVEKAKSARAELKRIGHPGPMQRVEIRELPERPDAPLLDEILAPLLAGRAAGLMSEAGCPAIADPGAAVVLRAHELGLRVVPLVGPSSVLLALMASGLNGQQFSFWGYLPIRDPDRSHRVQALERDSRRTGATQIFIETPYRNPGLFGGLLAALQPATRLCIARALTTADEAIATRTIARWREVPPPELERRPTVFLLQA